ncbi:MAG: DUF3800 domain-containing protein [bacterium]
MYILFLDESGDHNLTVVDKDYPLFVLAGCIMDDGQVNDLTFKMDRFKQEVFGNKKIILHYADFVRSVGKFEKMKEKSFREKFYDRLSQIINTANVGLVACIIDKKRHIEKYGMLAMDPYILSLEILVERYVMFLKITREKGIIVVESRGHQLDNELELAFLNLKINGTRFLRPVEIKETIQSFIFKKKEENVAGLQLVDVMVTPIGRRYLNKVNYYIQYDAIKKKFRKSSCGKYAGYGLVILPRKEKWATPATQ